MPGAGDPTPGPAGDEPRRACGLLKDPSSDADTATMLRILPATWVRRPSVVPAVAAATAAALLVALWTLGPLSGAVALLTAGPDDVRAALTEFGSFAPLASIGLNVLQGVIAPIPGFVVPFVNGIVFGAFWGAIVTWVGGIAAAAACFTISRTVGRRFAERVCRRSRTLENVNGMLEKHGLPAIVIARLLPGMPFDAFSYVGGLTRLRFSTFIAGTAIGSLPHAIVYSLVGAHLAVPLWAGLAVMPVIGLSVAGIHRIVSRLRTAPGIAHPAALTISHATLPRRSPDDGVVHARSGRCALRLHGPIASPLVAWVVPGAAYPEVARSLR